MNDNIEQLKNEVNNIKKSLNELKKNFDNSQEKKNEAEELKRKAEEIKKKVEAEIETLSKGKWSEVAEEKRKTKELLDSFKEITDLYNSIMNKWESTPEQSAQQAQQAQPETESKNIFSKAKDWIWEQRDNVWDEEKWKTEWWKNLLRTAWFMATWVWAVSLAYKGIKKLLWRGKNEDEDDKEDNEEEKKDKESKKKPFRSRWYWKVIWWWAALGWGYFLGKLLHLWWNNEEDTDSTPKDATGKESVETKEKSYSSTTSECRDAPHIEEVKGNSSDLKVSETWNYIKNWWTFHSPSRWICKRDAYRGVCSTWSFNVLRKLWLPKVSNSTNVDLTWKTLTKMWLKYIWETNPKNPSQNGYKPQDWDTAVWPKFKKKSGKITQHQATYVNWHWVSDNIQRNMSCYPREPNEPNCKIYRYVA